MTGAFEAAIRRVLNTLAHQGRLRKAHGGAVRLGEEFHGEEPDMETKRQRCTEEKERVAQYAGG